MAPGRPIFNWTTHEPSSIPRLQTSFRQPSAKRSVNATIGRTPKDKIACRVINVRVREVHILPVVSIDHDTVLSAKRGGGSHKQKEELPKEKSCQLVLKAFVCRKYSKTVCNKSLQTGHRRNQIGGKPHICKACYQTCTKFDNE